MANKIQELWNVLGTLGESSQFVTTGSISPILPGLEIKKVGPIGIPVSQADAKRLIKASSQAPYGRGEETIIDTSVRRVWQIEPKQISLQNLAWNDFLGQIVASVKSEFGIGQAVEPSLYKLLIYEPGSFFARHRDSEKIAGMFATLVVCLPSRHEAGSLVVTHDGQSKTIDFGGKNAEFQIQYAAFYADCQHEITPVTAGYRICLVYNLALAKGKRTPAVPQSSRIAEQAADLIARHFQAKAASDKLAIPLDHQYTQVGFGTRALKGGDRARADVLARAAEGLGYECYLALLTRHQVGEADYRTYDFGSRWGGRSRYRRYHDEDEEDDSDNSGVEIGEIYEDEQWLDHWFFPSGARKAMGKMKALDEEILNKPGSKKENFKQEVHEATGNEGVTVERWYHQAVIVMWPRERRCRILAREGPDVAIPALAEMIERAAKPQENADCLELAKQAMDHWVVDEYKMRPQTANAAQMLKLLCKLGSEKLVSQLIREILPVCHDGSEGKLIAKILGKTGWEHAEAALVTFFEKQRPDRQQAKLAPLVTIFESLCCESPAMTEERRNVCLPLAVQVEQAIEAWDSYKGTYDWYRRDEGRQGIPEAMLHALCALGDIDRASRLLERVLANPKRYPLHEVLIPAAKAVRTWSDDINPPSIFRRLADHCIEQLRSLTSEPIQPPADWSRPVDFKCPCPDCKMLARFLLDPEAKVGRFPLRKERRQHLHQQIDSCRCDCTHVTDRRGSPQTLVCTKTQASYERRRKQYDIDQELLRELASLAATPASAIPSPHKRKRAELPKKRSRKSSPNS
jgi:hypothetical protein